MLEESKRSLLRQLYGHAIEDIDYCKEALIGLADVIQAGVIQQDLLNNEYGNLGAFRRRNHGGRVPCAKAHSQIP